MAVKITTVGTLVDGLPGGKDELEAEGMTVSQALEALCAKHGRVVASELYRNGEVRPGLAFLVNGRNALGLPERMQTKLKAGDELIIATVLAGG